MSLKKIIDGNIEAILTFGLNGNLVVFIAPVDLRVIGIRLCNPADFLFNNDPGETITNNMAFDFVNKGLNNNRHVVIAHWTNWNEDFFAKRMYQLEPIELEIFNGFVGKCEQLVISLGSEGGGPSPTQYLLLQIEVESV